MSARPRSSGWSMSIRSHRRHAAAARRARRDRRPSAHLSRRPAAVHAGLARLRAGLVAAEPAGRAHAAGPRRQRHDGREHRAGPLRLIPAGCRAAASATTRMVVATAFTLGPTIASGILAVGPWPWLFAVNLPFGLIALAIGIKTLPPTPRAEARLRFPRRGDGRGLPRPLHHRHRRRRRIRPRRRRARHADRGARASAGS